MQTPYSCLIHLFRPSIRFSPREPSFSALCILRFIHLSFTLSIFLVLCTSLDLCTTISLHISPFRCLFFILHISTLLYTSLLIYMPLCFAPCASLLLYVSLFRSVYLSFILSLFISLCAFHFRYLPLFVSLYALCTSLVRSMHLSFALFHSACPYFALCTSPSFYASLLHYTLPFFTLSFAVCISLGSTHRYFIRCIHYLSLSLSLFHFALCACSLFSAPKLFSGARREFNDSIFSRFPLEISFQCNYLFAVPLSLCAFLFYSPFLPFIRCIFRSLYGPLFRFAYLSFALSFILRVPLSQLCISLSFYAYLSHCLSLYTYSLRFVHFSSALYISLNIALLIFLSIFFSSIHPSIYLCLLNYFLCSEWFLRSSKV